MAEITPGDALAAEEKADTRRSSERFIAAVAHFLTSGGNGIPISLAHIRDVPVRVVMVPDADNPQAGMPGAILIDRAVWEALEPDNIDAVKEGYQDPGDTESVVEP